MMKKFLNQVKITDVANYGEKKGERHMTCETKDEKDYENANEVFIVMKTVFVFVVFIVR